MKQKILYIERNKLSKSARGKMYVPYTMVEIVERLNFGRVKVRTYYFDIVCAYYPVNIISMDIVDEKDIKELNWENVINDLKLGSVDRKYWYWHFLEREYSCRAILNDENEHIVFWDKYVKIGRCQYPNLPQWTKGQITLWEIDTVLNYMVENNIDAEYARKLIDIIHEDDVTITVEEHLRKKGLIK